MKKKAGGLNNVYAGIRDRIVRMIAVTVVGRTDTSDPDYVRSVARRCGVEEQTLRDARALAIRIARDQGLDGERFPPRARLRVWMPGPVQEAWLDWCEAQAMDPATAIRSIVHQYLTGTYEVGHDAHCWRINGVRYAASFGGHRGKTFYEGGPTTAGAGEALDRRARLRNTNRSAMLRELVTAALEGRHFRVVRPVSLREIPSDPDAYPLPTKLVWVDAGS